MKVLHCFRSTHCTKTFCDLGNPQAPQNVCLHKTRHAGSPYISNHTTSFHLSEHWPFSPMLLLEPPDSGCSVTAPLKHGRRSTFHQWPQHLFPSLRNNLDTDLETPYVFDHFTGSFYWTREDALKDIKWNVWTDPPCLNCVGQKFAICQKL
jgi:hypothetical protein